MSDELRDKGMESEIQMCEELDSKSETNDNENNIKRIERRVYAKDSMDRFGDDLTELILSFFTIEDALRLECVSKQWQRYVFGKQFWLRMRIDDCMCDNSMHRLCGNKILSEDTLESVLKKFPNITKVQLFSNVKSESLSLIGQYCRRLRYLYFTITGIGDLDFALNYGHRLEELHIYRDPKLEYNKKNTELIKDFLMFCPNLKNIFIGKNWRLFCKNKEFLPNLERIKSKFEIKPEYVKQFKSLLNKYSQKLKTLFIWFDGLNAEELKTCV